MLPRTDLSQCSTFSILRKVLWCVYTVPLEFSQGIAQSQRSNITIMSYDLFWMLSFIDTNPLFLIQKKCTKSNSLVLSLLYFDTLLRCFPNHSSLYCPANLISVCLAFLEMWSGVASSPVVCDWARPPPCVSACVCSGRLEWDQSYLCGN